MADKQGSLSSGFVGGTFQNIVAALCATAAGQACFKLGLTASDKWDDLSNWPAYFVVLCVFIALGPVFHLLRRTWTQIDLWQRALRLKRSSAIRLSILLAEFEGDAASDIKDRIRADLNKVFGESAFRPFFIDEFPLVLRRPSSGREQMIRAQVIANGQRWLRRAGADLLIFGRALSNNETTIYFLQAHTSNLSDSKVYRFDTRKGEFGRDAGTAIAMAALMSVRPVFEERFVHDVKTDHAIDLVNKLQPFLQRPIGGFPENLREQIREAHSSALQGLGRKGILGAWDHAFKTLENNLASLDSKKSTEAWARAARHLAHAHFEAGEQFGVLSSLNRAALLYRQVLEVLPTQLKMERGLTEIDLGNALLAKGRTHDLKCCNEALDAFVRAEHLLDKDKSNVERAKAHIGISRSLFERTLGMKEQTFLEQIEHCISSCEGIGDYLNPATAPLAWTDAQIVHAMARRSFGAVKVDRQSLRQSISLLEHTLTTFDGFAAIDGHQRMRYRARILKECARSTYWLVYCGGTDVSIEKPVEMLRDAVDLLTPDRWPVEWALTKIRLGEALLLVLRFRTSRQVATEAIAVFREVANSGIRQKAPLIWCEARECLANALRLHASGSNDLSMFEEAITILRETIDEVASYGLFYMERRLQQALAEAAIDASFLSRDPALLSEAITNAKQSIQDLSREESPFFWATAHRLLGEIHRLTGDIGSFPRHILRALVHFKWAQTVFLRDTSTHEWAFLELYRGDAYLRLAEMQSGTGSIEIARQLYVSALQAYREVDAIPKIEEVEQKLHVVNGFLPATR